MTFAYDYVTTMWAWSTLHFDFEMQKKYQDLNSLFNELQGISAGICCLSSAGLLAGTIIIARKMTISTNETEL